MLVFDIGANIGDYSILLSKIVGSSGQVYSFEPASSTFKKLQERIGKLNCINTYPFQKAIYSENTNIEFNEFPDEYSVWNSIGKPQMLNPQCLAEEYVRIVNTEIVEAVTLDFFVKNITLEKLTI